jgi:hypothetical protein
MAHIVRNETHNPTFKLVGTTIEDKGKLIELVYGISNNGSGEGLEVYFYRGNDLSVGHYSSRRYINHEYPNKYRKYFVLLRKFVRDGKCKDGHKLTVKL